MLKYEYVNLHYLVDGSTSSLMHDVNVKSHKYSTLLLEFHTNSLTYYTSSTPIYSGKKCMWCEICWMLPWYNLSIKIEDYLI